MGKSTKVNGIHKRKGTSNGTGKMGKMSNLLNNVNNNNNNGNLTNSDGNHLADLRSRKRQKDSKSGKNFLRRTDRAGDIAVKGTVLPSNVFPRYTEVVVFLVTLCVRLRYVSQKRNWWILHPDEVFQITEVAHSEVYGYGFRPYEYLPPPQGNFTSRAARDEASLGMYGLRSFILPKLFMVVFTLAECIGINDRPFVVAKLFHAAVSSALPLSMYRLAHVLFASHDVAVLAAILGAASLHLTLFGTHVLVNSFLAPVVFWCIASVLDTLFIGENGSHVIDSPGVGSYLNGALINNNNNNNVDAVHHGQKLDSEPFPKLHAEVKNRRTFFIGFCLGLCAYIRIDLVLFLTVFFMPFTLLNLRWSLCFFVLLLKYLTSFVIGMVTAGIDDWLSYGKWGLSIYQWMRFNVMSGLSATFFGESVSTKYVNDILCCDWFSLSMAVFTVGVIITQIWSQSFRKHYRDFATCLSLLFVFGGLLLIYSSQPHKETRFLHNAIVVLCVLQARLIWGTTIVIGNAFQITTRGQSIALLGFAFLFTFSSWTSFPNTSDGSYFRWVFHPDRGSHDVNQCLSYVSQQDDVTGVFNGYSMQGSGAFSVLHKDVTMLTLVHQEFCEYSPEARTTVQSVNPLRLKPYTINVTLANRVTDYITSNNLAYLYKILVEDSVYNYAIVPRGTEFNKLGYFEVFHSGDAKVVKRSVLPEIANAAKAFVSSLPVWTNATVLEYEGGWLLSLGASSKAIPRLERALGLARERTRVFQLLMTAYDKTGQKAQAIRVQQECFNLHGREACLTPQRRVELYSMYADRQ